MNEFAKTALSPVSCQKWFLKWQSRALAIAVCPQQGLLNFFLVKQSKCSFECEKWRALSICPYVCNESRDGHAQDRVVIHILGSFAIPVCSNKQKNSTGLEADRTAIWEMIFDIPTVLKLLVFLVCLNVHIWLWLLDTVSCLVLWDGSKEIPFLSGNISFARSLKKMRLSMQRTQEDAQGETWLDRVHWNFLAHMSQGNCKTL